NNPLQQEREFIAVGQREIQHRDFFFQLGGNLQRGRDEDDRFETVLQVQRDLLELPNDGEVVLREERVEILEDENGWLDLFDDLIQRGERVLRRGVAVLL